MFQRVEQELQFEKKRNKKLITPCCGKSNADGKFVTYKGFSEVYGYCHSCGVTSLPPALYVNEKGEEFIWDELTSSFKSNVLQNVIQSSHESVSHKCNTAKVQKLKLTRYIDFQVVECCFRNIRENNLLHYLRSKYPSHTVDQVKKLYYIGTSKRLGTVFWLINVDKKVQKAKVVYYTKDGKRTDRFEVPYKNDDGYYSCLFGEHLLRDNINKPVMLVESEKTAIVASIEYPKYMWLAYGGMNGLTDDKLKVLIGRKVVVIPDMSEKAVGIIEKKIDKMCKMGIDATIFDMTESHSDDELKELGWYNCDVEDVFRAVSSL